MSNPMGGSKGRARAHRPTPVRRKDSPNSGAPAGTAGRRIGGGVDGGSKRAGAAGAVDAVDAVGRARPLLSYSGSASADESASALGGTSEGARDDSASLVVDESCAQSSVVSESAPALTVLGLRPATTTRSDLQSRRPSSGVPALATAWDYFESAPMVMTPPRECSELTSVVVIPPAPTAPAPPAPAAPPAPPALPVAGTLVPAAPKSPLPPLPPRSASHASHANASSAACTAATHSSPARLAHPLVLPAAPSSLGPAPPAAPS